MNTIELQNEIAALTEERDQAEAQVKALREAIAQFIASAQAWDNEHPIQEVAGVSAAFQPGQMAINQIHLQLLATRLEQI